MTDRPSHEEWDEWRNGACGKWFFDHYLPTREDQMRYHWTLESWHNGKADQQRLNELRSCVTAIKNVREAEYGGILQDLGIGVEDE